MPFSTRYGGDKDTPEKGYVNSVLHCSSSPQQGALVALVERSSPPENIARSFASCLVSFDLILGLIVITKCNK